MINSAYETYSAKLIFEYHGTYSLGGFPINYQASVIDSTMRACETAYEYSGETYCKYLKNFNTKTKIPNEEKIANKILSVRQYSNALKQPILAIIYYRLERLKREFPKGSVSEDSRMFYAALRECGSEPPSYMRDIIKLNPGTVRFDDDLQGCVVPGLKHMAFEYITLFPFQSNMRNLRIEKRDGEYYLICNGKRKLKELLYYQ